MFMDLILAFLVLIYLWSFMCLLVLVLVSILGFCGFFGGYVFVRVIVFVCLSL